MRSVGESEITFSTWLIVMTSKWKVGIKWDHLLLSCDLGACEASLACTTCHVYVEGKYFDELPQAHEE